MNVPDQSRQFAISVVQKLRDAGYQALWAGGCVRDQRLGLIPKDYDVATTATPEQIRAVFGRRQTLEIGVAFGVITVLGGPENGQVEVATFRRDAGYSDGRHPDQVTFSSPEEDAQRRDFTINGLFHDPLTGQDIDYVNGGEDLRRKVIRAIGSPHDRVAEDKLRMLRAVRFAATYGFSIEEKTFAAVQQHAAELTVVSAERIAAEMRRMLVHDSRRTAVELLVATGLLGVILPEATAAKVPAETPATPPVGISTLRMLDALVAPSFAVAMAVLLRELILVRVNGAEQRMAQAVTDLCHRWRLSNDELAGITLCLQHERLLRDADARAWPEVQRVLTSNRIEELLTYVAAVSRVLDEFPHGLQFCRQKLALPPAQWNPAPLITGDDLKAAGLRPGPGFRRILDGVRDAQLLGEISDRSQALLAATRLSEALRTSSQGPDGDASPESGT